MNSNNNNDHLNNIYLEFSLLNNFLKELKENIKKSNNEKYTNIYDGCVEYIYSLHNKYTAWNYNTEKIDEKYIDYFVQSIILNIKNFLRNHFCLIDEDIECLKNKNKKLMEKLKSGVENAETQENYIYELEKKLIFEKEKNKSSYNLHDKINNLLKLNEQLTNKNEQLECSSFKHKQENNKLKIELKKFWALKEKKKKYEQNKFSYYMLNKKMSTLLKKINNHIPTHQNNFLNEKNRSYSYNFVHTLKKYIILRDSPYLNEFNINTYTNNYKKSINNNINDNHKMYNSYERYYYNGNVKYDNKKYNGNEKYDNNDNKMYYGNEKYNDDNKKYDADNNKTYDDDDNNKKYDNDNDNNKKYDDDNDNNKKYDDDDNNNKKCDHDDNNNKKYDHDDNNKKYDHDDNNKKYDHDDNNKKYDHDNNNKKYDHDDNNKKYDHDNNNKKYDHDDNNKKYDHDDNNKYCCDNKDTNFNHINSSSNPHNTKYICYESSEYIKKDDIYQGYNDTLNYHNKNINEKHTKYVNPENSSSSNNSKDIYNINKRDTLSIHKTKHIQTYETVPSINHCDTYINDGYEEEEEHTNNDHDGKKDKLYNFTNNPSMYKMYNNSEITCTEESDHLYKNIEYINKKKTFYTNDNNKNSYLINNIKLKNSNTLNEAYFSRRILYSTTLLMDIRKTLRYNRNFLKNSILCKKTKKIKRKKEKLKTLMNLHQKNHMINDYHHSNDEMHAIKNMLIEDYRGTIIKFYECIKKDIRIIIESNYNLNLDLLSQYSQNIISEIREEKNTLRKKNIDKITRKYLRQIDSYRLCEKDFYHNMGNEENKNEKHLYLNYHKYDSLDLRKILKNNYQQNTYGESEEPFSFNFYEHGNIKIIDRLKELKSNISFFKFYDLIDFPTRI
ncbi:conserved Plasmodium protein, unknown function [Plasmodium reichenowi]|uniref:Uncharacterized protein n=1 Tax=Plasmodium reichenowi TaxID=5854 RepID=A0A2P9DI13_PLARE|nr:conserved Plasmodium protein, unknown function [Plasmodium reichenowi]